MLYISPNSSRRIPDNHSAVRHITDDDRSGSDYAVLPDPYPLNDYRSRSNP